MHFDMPFKKETKQLITQRSHSGDCGWNENMNRAVFKVWLHFKPVYHIQFNLSLLPTVYITTPALLFLADFIFGAK